MRVHGKAVEAYKTLAKYMQKNCVRAIENVARPLEVCEKCPFCYRKFTCLIQRLGTYPSLALEDDAIEGIKARVKEMEQETTILKKTKEIENCWLCGGEADTSVDDDGCVFIGCDKDANCPNNIFNSENAFENEFDAIVWWNNEARNVYAECPKGKDYE